MKMNSSLDQYEYTVSGHAGFDLTHALRLWKTKYQDDIRDFYKEVCNHSSMDDLKEFATECWETLEPVTVTEAFKEKNIERRRTYFDCIGVAKLMKEIQAKLLDRQVVTKKRFGWDEDNNQVEKVFEDTYELYEIDANKLYGDTVPINQYWRVPSNPQVVRCWCTTTNREYWIFTQNLGNSYYSDPETGKWITRGHDAIESIAWTIRIDVKDPERIYRQGDIIVVKHDPEAEKVSPYHLNKKMYLELMYSET